MPSEFSSNDFDGFGEIGVSSGAAWTPASLSNLSHWYRARSLSGLADNDPVPTLTDLKGSANFTGSGVTRPLYKSNGGDPYLLFNGVNSVMASAAILAANSVIVAVFEYVTFNAYGILLADSTSLQIGYAAAATDFYAHGPGDAGSLTGVLTGPPTGPLAVLIESLSAAGRMRINGVQITGPLGLGVSASIQLGQLPAAPGSYNGSLKFKEMLLCTGAFAAGEETALRAYISSQYGLTL